MSSCTHNIITPEIARTIVRATVAPLLALYGVNRCTLLELINALGWSRALAPTTVADAALVELIAVASLLTAYAPAVWGRS